MCDKKADCSIRSRFTRLAGGGAAGAEGAPDPPRRQPYLLQAPEARATVSGCLNGTPLNTPPPRSRWSLSWSSLSWECGYDGSGSRNCMKTAMIVTMATTAMANFIMNHTSCVTTIPENMLDPAVQ